MVKKAKLVLIAIFYKKNNTLIAINAQLTLEHTLFACLCVCVCIPVSTCNVFIPEPILTAIIYCNKHVFVAMKYVLEIVMKPSFQLNLGPVIMEGASNLFIMFHEQRQIPLSLPIIIFDKPHFKESILYTLSKEHEKNTSYG